MAAEKNFENKIKGYLKEHGAYFVKFFANRMTKVGVPDILACVNGYFVGIEVKAQNGKPSELQKHNRLEIRKANGLSVILYPQDYELFQELVNCLNNGHWFDARKLCDKINERSL